ncbi:glycosyltransferase family 4 protein [Kaarinaea lacus]
MSTAIVLTSYYRPKPGGFCKRYFRAINALLEQGAKVHYLAVEQFPIKHVNCHFHRFPWPKNYTDNLLFWICFHLFAPLFLLYIGFRFRITHSFAFGATYAFLLQPLRLLKRIPLALFLRGDAIASHRVKGKPGWIILLDQFFEGLAIQGVGLYGVSDSLTLTVVGRHVICKPARHSTLRNNLDVFKDSDRASYELPLTIGCVGILEKTKNQQVLIKCLDDLGREAVKLNLYGIGPDREMLITLAERLGVSHQLDFKGWVNSESIWPHIDLLAMPSLYEGAPNAVLEALSNRIPVLASDIPAHSEILPAESLVPVESAAAWSEKIKKLIAKTSLLNDLQTSQERYSKKLLFNWDSEISNLILEG